MRVGVASFTLASSLALTVCRNVEGRLSDEESGNLDSLELFDSLKGLLFDEWGEFSNYEEWLQVLLRLFFLGLFFLRLLLLGLLLLGLLFLGLFFLGLLLSLRFDFRCFFLRSIFLFWLGFNGWRVCLFGFLFDLCCLCGFLLGVIFGDFGLFFFLLLFLFFLLDDRFFLLDDGLFLLDNGLFLRNFSDICRCDVFSCCKSVDLVLASEEGDLRGLEDHALFVVGVVATPREDLVESIESHHDVQIADDNLFDGVNLHVAEVNRLESL